MSKVVLGQEENKFHRKIILYKKAIPTIVVYVNIIIKVRNNAIKTVYIILVYVNVNVIIHLIGKRA